MSRNILEYPITKDEVIEVLSDAMEKYEGLIGGQHAYILSSLIPVIEREFRHEDFNPYTKEDLIGQESASSNQQYVSPGAYPQDFDYQGN